MSPKKEYSEDEIQSIKEQAVISAKVEELTDTVPEIFAAIKSLTRSIADIPAKITQCRDDMDREIKAYMHDRFLTEHDLREFEEKVERKIEPLTKQINRQTWIVTGFIAAGVFATWVMKFTGIFTHIQN